MSVEKKKYEPPFPEGDEVKHDEAIDALGEGRCKKAADSTAHRMTHADATLKAEMLLHENGSFNVHS